MTTARSRTKSLRLVACFLFAPLTGWSQGSVQPPANRILAMPGQPAQDAFVVTPDGRLIKSDRPPAIRLQSEVLNKEESIKDILTRHHLADDAKTRAMFKALNPAFDLSKGGLKTGSRVDIFTVAPDAVTQPSNLKFTFDSPNLARYAFYTQANHALGISEVAKRLSPSAFGDPTLAKLHVRSTDEIQSAAKALETRADKLSRLDYAVAQYQIDYANKQAAIVNARALKGDVTREQVLTSVASANIAREMGERVAAGQSPSELRNVRVNVYRGDSTEHVKPLQVYVLPSGALAEPQLWTPGQMQSFLADFSFANDASPVAQDIPTNFDPRICVGPKNALAAMAKLITERKLTTCRKPEGGNGATGGTITFRSPADVAKP